MRLSGGRLEFGNGEAECQAGGLTVEYFDITAERFYGNADYGQAEACASGNSWASGIHSIESVEYMREVLRRNSYSIIVKFEVVEFVVLVHHFQHTFGALGIEQGIAAKIHKRPCEQCFVGDDYAI